MVTPYRQSLIKMLCPECTYIENPVEELRKDICNLNYALLKRARLHIYWIGAFSSFLLFAIMYWIEVPTYANLVVAILPIAIAHLLVPTRFTKAFIGYISRRQEFQRQHEAIGQHGRHIEQLTRKAKLYQNIMEPEGAPGLVAVYADVINKPYFKCPVKRSERAKAISNSIEGRGRDIHIIHYGAILKTLKEFDFDRYLRSKKFVGIDFLHAGSRSSIAIQCSYLIANHILGNSKSSTSTIEHAMIIGVNAVFSGSNTGLPSTATMPQTNLYTCAGRLLDSLYKKQVDTEELSSEFLGLFKKAVSHDESIGAFVPDIPEVA